MQERIDQLMEQRRQIDAELKSYGVYVENGEPVISLHENHGPDSLYDITERSRERSKQETINGMGFALSSKPVGWLGMLDEGIKKLR